MVIEEIRTKEFLPRYNKWLQDEESHYSSTKLKNAPQRLKGLTLAKKYISAYGGSTLGFKKLRTMYVLVNYYKPK